VEVKSIWLVAALGRACRAIGYGLIVAASLLVFPNAIPWLIAAWLAGYTALVIVGRRGTLCLLGCLAVLIAKRLTPAPALLGCMGVMVAIILLDIWYARRGKVTSARKIAWLSTVALWIAWCGMTLDWRASAHCRHLVVLKLERPVVCFGDSMTSLGKSVGYPRDLQRLISLPVFNLGIGGISAKDTVENYLPELTRLNPQVVVIELGGHDFLHDYSRASTKARLKRIIDTVRRIGAEVVLVEMPRAFVSDPYWGLEREIARQEDVELVPDTAMRTIFLRSTAFPPGTWLGPPYLTDESGIHPNERGNEILAKYVAEALQRMYGRQIIRTTAKASEP
jgi:acyl-CoA thioesterase I